MKKLLAISLLVLLCFSCTNKQQITLPYFNTSDFTPVWLNKTDPEYKKLHTISSFSLIDQHGKVITERTTSGKIYVANFFFTRCANICPKMMDNLKKAAATFAPDSNVLIVSHSVTPLYDNVAVLKNYAEEKDINQPNWHLVTGDKDQIYNLARTSYFADTVTSSAITTTFLHTENLILVDKNRHIRGVYNGTIPFEVENLIRHIRILEKED